VAATDRARLLNPNSAVVLGFSALTGCICGAYEMAIQHAEKAVQLSPAEPLIYVANFSLAYACLRTGRAEEAVAHARKAIDGNRNFAFSYVVLGLACAELGRHDEAAQAISQLRAKAPGFRSRALRSIRFSEESFSQSDLASLRAAGLPD
jgi:adenylate cyclase